jgi:hypothetical protein
VALAALIIASDDDGASVGSASLFGMPVLEFQARQAAAAGARHIIIHTDRVPANLVSALDQLKSDGLAVALVRTAREAADAVHPDELVLVMAGPVQANMGFLKQHCDQAEPLILTRMLVPNSVGQELIDADHAWAGMALLQGQLLRHTATMLGDWALAPTLLRLGVQAGAKRLLLDGPLASMVKPATALAALDSGPEVTLADRFPAFLARKVAALPYRLTYIAGLPLALIILACALVLAGWVVSGLVLFVAVTVPAAAIDRLADAALFQSKWLAAYARFRPWAAWLLIGATSFAPLIAGSGSEAAIIGLWIIWLFAVQPLKQMPLYFCETSAIMLIIAGLLSPFPVAGFVAALVHGLSSSLKVRFSELP